MAFIFVYGGLMRGFDLHHYLAGAIFEGSGWTKGTLLAVGRYPGLVAGDDQVQGELYRLADPQSELEPLDDLEEFDPADPEHSLYVRTRAQIHKDDGTTVNAWLYVYNGKAEGFPVVRDGDWRATPPPS